MTITIIIPNYRDEQYLEYCINSVLFQAEWVDEIIYIDDASPGEGMAIAKKLLINFPNAKFVKNEINLGVMRSLNIGLDLVSSTHVLFLSANDFILPGLLSSASKAIQEFSPGVWSAMIAASSDNGKVLGSIRTPIVSLKQTYLSPQRCIYLANKVGSWFTGTTMFYSVAALRSIGGFNPKFGGAADLLAALAISSLHGAIFSPQIFGAIRTHRMSYSNDTFSSLEKVIKMNAELSDVGSKLSKDLFTPAFVSKTQKRFLYRHKAVDLNSNLACKLFWAIKFRYFDIVNNLVYRYIYKRLK